ncbi:outer membrane protein assembly factor BamE [Pseudomonadota bacterium]
MKILRVILLAVAVVYISACNIIYKLDVQQGNLITDQMIDKLKPGMSQKAVKSILGTPLVADPFHKDRWDYYYGYRNGRAGTEEHHNITVIFEDKKFVRIEGDLSKVVKTDVDNKPFELNKKN